MICQHSDYSNCIIWQILNNETHVYPFSEASFSIRGNDIHESFLLSDKSTKRCCRKHHEDNILGTAAAILVLNGLAVLAGGLVSALIPDWLIKVVAALAFLYFAASTLAGDEEEEEEGSTKSRIQFAPLAVFCTFFVAELGDKTQLTAITFGANEGMGAALVVWIGCSLGLFAADILGMLVGYLLKSKTPDGLLNTLAFAIFTIFGIYTFYQGLKLVQANVFPVPVWPVLIAVTAIFVVICALLFAKKSTGK